MFALPPVVRGLAPRTVRIAVLTILRWRSDLDYFLSVFLWFRFTGLVQDLLSQNPFLHPLAILSCFADFRAYCGCFGFSAFMSFGS